MTSIDKYLQKGVAYRNLLLIESANEVKTPEKLLAEWSESNESVVYYSSIDKASKHSESEVYKKCATVVPAVMTRLETLRKISNRIGAVNMRLPSSIDTELVDTQSLVASVVEGLGFECLAQMSASHLKVLARLMIVLECRKDESFEVPERSLCFIFAGKLCEVVEEQRTFAVGEAFGDSDLLRNMKRSSTVQAIESSWIGVVSTDALQAALAQQTVIDENRICDFISTHAPFSLVPFHRTSTLLPNMNTITLKEGEQFDASIWFVMKGSVRVSATITIKNDKLQVYEQVPLFDINEGHIHGLSETGFGPHIRVVTSNAVITHVTAVAMSECKVITFTKQSFSEMLATTLDLNLALFHLSRAIKEVEDAHIAQVLVLIQKHDFCTKSSEYIQSAKKLSRTFSHNVENLPIMQDLADYGRQVQLKELENAKTYKQASSMRDRLNIEKISKTYSWRDSKVREATAKGEYYHRVNSV